MSRESYSTFLCYFPHWRTTTCYLIPLFWRMLVEFYMLGLNKSIILCTFFTFFPDRSISELRFLSCCIRTDTLKSLTCEGFCRFLTLSQAQNKSQKWQNQQMRRRRDEHVSRRSRLLSVLVGSLFVCLFVADMCSVSSRGGLLSAAWD